MPIPRIHCCAITPAGTRCTRHTASDEMLGRCKTHYDQSFGQPPAAWAVREFGYVLRNTTVQDARVAANFPDGIVPFAALIHNSIRRTLGPWITANTNTVQQFYATRAVGTKVDVTNFIAAYEARMEIVAPQVVAGLLAHDRWGPLMRGEPAAPAVPAAPAAPRARAPRVPRVPVGELGAFAADNQNVHTAQSVEMTKTVVQRVLKIAVDKEYQWNRTVVSRTPAEIIWACRLSPQVAMQMMQKYCAADNVYELGPGIYGKVLDGVYAYIKSSPDKKDLYKILRQELSDNLGMCAQGNLTRLCNVLAGYLEGIGSQESPADRLGRELPKLIEIADETRRMEIARGVLRDTGLPEAEWAPWLEALS